MGDLADTTWVDVGRRPTVLVPVGSIEQHGPHLPLDTDTAIAVAVATEVAARQGTDGDEPWVAPALAYGSSGEHQSFEGTSSIGADALHLVVLELVRSLSTWAGRIVLVNAHGGNVPVLVDAVRHLRDEGHDVTWAACATEDVDLHAGHTETSLMLHIRPESVRLERAEAGDTRPLREILPLMMAGGVAAVTPNGVLGDPTAATADEGRRVFDAMAAAIDDLLERGIPDAHGRLSLRSVA